jgi:hypothetical protein
MANRLTNLRVPRVSFVARAAVRDPADPSQPRRFVFMKSEGLVPANPMKGAQMDPLTDAQKAELDPTVREALEKAGQDAVDAQAAATKAQGERDEAIAKAGKQVNSTDGTGDGKPASKAKDGRDGDDDGDAPGKLNKGELDAAAAAAVKKAEEERDEAIRKADERATNAENIAKAERDARVTTEWVKKAETGDLRGLPGAPADIGPIMKSLAEAAPEAWSHFEKSVLLPAVAQIRESDLFKEQGRGGEGPPPESAVAKMREKVGELQKADPSLTRSTAMERVRKSDPELQSALASELGSAADPSVRQPEYR